jgi:glycosyltransferase involved in cell wall biosynthesis
MAADEPQTSAAARREYDLAFITRSGLFETQYYLTQYPDIAAASVAPLEHFYDYGHLEGRRPNFYFDPLWYLSQNPDVRDAGVHPLLHYASYGDLEGRRPSGFFDPSWYRKKHGLGEGQSALSHYLEHRKACQVAPIAEFDIEHYARSYPDVAGAGIDPFEHFVAYGYLEGRSPSTQFDSKFYWQRYLKGDRSQHPFLHFLAHKHEPGVFGRMPEDETSIPREVKRFTKPAAEFEEFAPLPASAPRRAKLLTYYLPQFHAFPENDVWWGKGFTEWTNVPRGLPRFKGHYQPRIPRDLGFYSLDHIDVMRRQVEMAKAGGVFGFVFYYYWFNRKRILDKPTDAFLATPSLDMPFCLMWANENWTRRWDGADAEVLISQDYRLEDEEAMLADFDRHFKQARYIRLQGRPLMMIYRPGLIPDAKITIARWRSVFKEKFGEDPLFVMGQTFNATDPTEFGMDGAIEFPPHKLTQHMQPVNESLQYLDIEFEGKAYRYDDVVDISLKESKPVYPLIKTAVPSWDNDARRQGNGLVLIDSTPQKYQAWLGELVERAVQNPFFGEPLVCVNAWNEWCEGAYLEPDLHYGCAYLNATARALVGKAQETGDGRVLLVGHDCFPSGAQQLLLKIGRTLKSHYGVQPAIVLLDGGKLEGAYRELGPVRIVGASPALDSHLLSLRESGYVTAIVNTSAAAAAVPALKKAGIEVTMLVHELPRILKEKNLSATARIAAQRADRLVFPSPFVRGEYTDHLRIDRDERMLIVPQGMYQKIEVSQALREERRKEFNVLEDQRLVIGMGYADMRKGFDLFLQVWRLARNAGSLVLHFCWVGDMDPALKNMMQDEIDDAEATQTFHMAGYRKDVSSFLSAADAFVLSSREDPFPSVVLEALYAALPVLAFDRSGGMPDVLRDHPLGHVVPFGDTVAMGKALIAATTQGPSEVARAAGRELIEQQFDFSAYVWRLLKLGHKNLPEISVVVPNYNYAKHLSKRLGSIFLQTQPVKEILVLDDCSTDDSLEVIPVVAAEWDRHIRLLPNTINSGSVFKQWRKAAETATGEFLWIAEADDLSAPRFLSEVIALMRHEPDMKFAFCDSSAIDGDGNALWPSYKGYYATVAPDALTKTQVYEAPEFVERFMSVKNLILNVSAVVWRREALLEAMDASEAELRTYKMAGDWHLYLQALSTPGAQVGYCAEPLNTHRRHGASVTHALDANKHVAEIAACQEFARSAFALSEGVQKTQVGYLREVSVQLGATSKKLESSQSEIKVAAKAGGPRTSKVFKRKS